MGNDIATRGGAQLALPQFSHPTYLLRRKFFQFFGAAFHIFDPAGNVAFYSKQKAFKLKEDIRVYSGEDMKTELLTIQARRILDISAAYDVVDSRSGQKVGTLKRRGLKSFLRDEWAFLDDRDNELGVIQEDSTLMALVRRFLTNIIPQSFHGQIGGARVCRFHQHWNPFIQKITLDFREDAAGRLDRRLGIAAAILLCAIEGRQKGG